MQPARKGNAALSGSRSYSSRKRSSARTITPQQGCYRRGSCPSAHVPIDVATPPVRDRSSASHRMAKGIPREGQDRRTM